MRLKLSLLTVVLLVGFFAQAHEFWMEPRKFYYQPGESMVMEFMVGEDFAGEKWGVKKDRIVKLDQYSGNQSRDIAAGIKATDENVSVELSQVGTHLFSMRSNNAFIELGAEDFNNYLKEDGLDEILTQREKTNSLDKPGKEYYARCAKLLVQVGDTRDETYKKVTGLPLEIIPMRNPYELELTEEVQFKILFEGKPLPYAKVRVWNRGKGRTFIHNVYTSKDGTISTRLSNEGVWMISTVKMIPSRQPGADWQSFWSSLVFGFNQENGK